MSPRLRGDAQITFTNTISIDRPAAEVYTYLSELEHVPQWNWAVTSTTKTTPGPITVGTRYRQTRNVPQPATETLEITALEPHQRIEIKGTLAEFPSRLRYDLTESDTGTELTNTVSLEAHGPADWPHPSWVRASRGRGQQPQRPQNATRNCGPRTVTPVHTSPETAQITLTHALQ